MDVVGIISLFCESVVYDVYRERYCFEDWWVGFCYMLVEIVVCYGGYVEMV